jgi:hypothetical protein
MLLIDQLDFINPDHVTILCKHDRLTIHISDGNSSVRLTYQLQQEDTTPVEVTKDPGLCKDSGLCVDPILNEVTYKGPYFCTPPHPPLEQSEPDSNGSSEPERPLRGM